MKEVVPKHACKQSWNINKKKGIKCTYYTKLLKNSVLLIGLEYLAVQKEIFFASGTGSSDFRIFRNDSKVLNKYDNNANAENKT